MTTAVTQKTTRRKDSLIRYRPSEKVRHMIDIIKREGYIRIKDVYDEMGVSEMESRHLLMTASVVEGLRIYEERIGAYLYVGWLE